MSWRKQQLSTEKKENFKWISTTFNHCLFRNNVFYKLVFITYVSDIQFRWDSNQQSKHIFDLRYQPMHLSWIINFQKCGRHWIALNTACVLSHFSRVQLCSPMDCRLPGPSVHRILQARILEWVVMPFSRGSSQPRDWTCVSPVSCISRQVFFFTTSAIWEALCQRDYTSTLELCNHLRSSLWTSVIVQQNCGNAPVTLMEFWRKESTTITQDRLELDYKQIKLITFDIREEKSSQTEGFFVCF